MGRIRALTKEDVPAIADLHMRVWRHSQQPASPALRRYFEEIFFHSPWYDEALPALVYEETTGKIGGFLGIMPRQLLLHGQPMRTAVYTHGMVDPGSRSKGAFKQLLETCYAGPQDLTMSDQLIDLSRRVCENMGSTTALLHSMYWLRILRPGGYAMSLLHERKPLAPLAFVAGPVCHMADALVTRVPQNPFRQVAPAVTAETLTVETLLECISHYTDHYALRPAYDKQSLAWLLAMVMRKKRPGLLQQIALRDSQGDIMGWYLYYLKPGGVSQVVQIGTRPDTISEVLDHLLYHAWRHGAAALAGRLDPKCMADLSKKACLFRCSGSWTVVHSQHPELLQAVHRGDAFLTRLEGEWWTSFGEG